MAREMIFSSQPPCANLAKGEFLEDRRMILTCPSCSTRYLSDPTSLNPNGRMVRCANCGHSWFQKPPDDMPKQVAGATLQLGGTSGSQAAAPVVPGLGGAERFSTEQRPSRRRGFSASTFAIWILVLLAIGVVVAAVYQYRVEIVRGWPQTASLYNLTGVEVISSGLDFRDVTFERTTNDGLPMLTVRGQVVNITDQSLPIPRLRITLRDVDEVELYHWTFALQQTRIGPGTSTDFVTRLASPPVGAYDFEVRFDEDRE